jgi:hypothetical protein
MNNLPIPVLRKIKSFGIGSKLGFISHHNLDLQTTDFSTMRQELDELKENTNSATILERFWMYPEMWKYLGESKKNIFSEAIRHGVFLDKLYKDDFVEDSMFMDMGKSGSLSLINEVDSILMRSNEIYHATKFKRSGISFTSEVSPLGVDWYKISLGAAYAGHTKLFQYSQTHINAKYPSKYWNSVLEYASEGGSFAILTIAIENGANEWVRGLIASSGSSNVEMIKFFLDRVMCSEGPDRISEDLIDDCIESSCINGQLETLTFLIGIFGDINSEPSFRRPLIMSGLGNNVELIRFLINHALFVFEENIVRTLIDSSSLKGSIDCVIYLLNMFPQVVNEDNLREWLLSASRNGHMNLMSYLVSIGANNFSEAVVESNKLGHYFEFK